MEIQNSGSGRVTDNTLSSHITNHIYLSPGPEHEEWIKKTLTYWQSSSKEKRINVIMEFLISTVDPVYVFLRNCPEFEEPDNKSITQFLIVLPESYPVSIKDSQPFLNLIGHNSTDLLLSLHQLRKVEIGLSVGDPFYSLHFIEDNMIFSKSEYKLPVTPHANVEQVISKMESFFENAMNVSNEFISSAEGLIATKHFDLATNLLNHAAEMCYKAISGSLGFLILKTRRLRKLEEIALRYIPQISDPFKNRELYLKLDKARSLHIEVIDKVDEAEISAIFKNVKSLHYLAYNGFTNAIQSFKKLYPQATHQ